MREIVYGDGASLRYEGDRFADLRIHVARSFADRFIGLMGQPEVPVGCGVAFPRCSSIHMFHMRTPIDVVWLGRPDGSGEARVLRVVRRLAPGKISFGPTGTWGVLELAPGAIDPGNDPISLVAESLSKR